MFTSLDSHTPAVVETGLACMFRGTRGWITADAHALARRIAP
jgi:hypothetical protein